MDDYLSWGWKFKASVDQGKRIVEFYPCLGRLVERLSIVEVCLLIGQSDIARDRSVTVELTVRNKFQASTTVERVRIAAAMIEVVDWKLKKEHVSAGATAKIHVPCFASWLGDVWEMGGRLDLEVVHTYGVETLSFEVSSLRDKNLPYLLFPRG